VNAPEPRPLGDVVEDELIEADNAAHRLFGPRDSEWNSEQRADYFTALGTIHIQAVA
jgi:hypothetical protein